MFFLFLLFQNFAFLSVIFMCHIHFCSKERRVWHKWHGVGYFLLCLNDFLDQMCAQFRSKNISFVTARAEIWDLKVKPSFPFLQYPYQRDTAGQIRSLYYICLPCLHLVAVAIHCFLRGCQPIAD